jgi:hypothetical protein
MAVVVPIISEWDPKGLNKATSDFKRAEGGWSKAGAGLKAAFLPAVAGLAGLGAAGIKFAKMASEDQASAARMAKALTNVTGATESQIAATEDWISAQGKALGVADDDLRPAIQTLASATGDLSEAQSLAGLAMDVAASSGTDVATAAKAIAKATDGSYGSLKKLVPGIDDAALASKDFGRVMESTSKIVGGQAADAAGTAEGQQKRLALSLSETAESIGGALLPVIEKILPMFQSLATFIANNTTAFIALAAVVGTIAVVIVTLNVAMGVYATIMGVVEANQKRATAGQWALNASMLANPVLLIVVGIIALIAALVIAYKKSETFRNIVNAAFAGVKAGISAAITAVVAVLRVAFKIMATLFRFTPLGFLITHFKEFARVAQVVADAVVGVFRWMFDQVKAIFDRIGDLVNKVKGWASFLPGVGRSAASGVSSAFAVPSVGVGARTAFAGDTGSLGATTINVRAIDPEGTAREVQGILDRHSTRQGRAPGAPRRRAW